MTSYSRSLGAVLIGAVLATSQASAEEKGGVITVLNKSSNPIWVTVTSQKPNVREFSESSENERSMATEVGVKQAKSMELAGVGGVSNEMSANVKHSDSRKEARAKSEKLDWSPFIEAGEAELKPGQKEEFRVNDDTYYFTVRRTENTFWRMNVSKDTKSAKNLIIGDDGYWDPQGEVVKAGDKITLSFAGTNLSLTRPIDSHALYHVANGGASAVTHIIEPVDKRPGPITNEEVVRFKIEKPKYPGKHYLLHGARDNLYYEDYPDDGASHWQVQMLKRDGGRELRSGMEVQLQGIRWDKYMTIVEWSGTQWAKAVKQGAGETIWTINKDVEPEPLRK